MRLAVIFAALLGLLAGHGTGNDSLRKKSATLLPSFTVTPTATVSTGTTSQEPTTTTLSPTTTSQEPTKTTHNYTTTSQKPTTTMHNSTTTTSQKPTTTMHNSTTTTSQKPTTTMHNSTTTTSQKPTTTQNPTTTTHGNTTVLPTTNNSTATSPGVTSSARPGPPPPSPSPGSNITGDYTWNNGSQPCVRLQAQIHIRILYPTQAGKEVWGTSVLNPNKTKVQGGCENAHPQLLLSFPYGQLSFGFKQEPLQNTVYLNYMAVEYNVSFPQATKSTFSVKNSSLQALQVSLGHSFSCENASITLSPAFHLDLLHLKLQAAQLPLTGDFGPSVSCASEHSTSLPLIIGLILLGLLTLVLVTFCIVRRRSSTYQPL